MGLRIQNNISALNAHRQLTQSDSMMGKSLERLSSGYRINKAADDAAGLSISQSFRADIASYKVAGRNVSEANAMAQVAEGAYDQIGTMLTRLKELATQASSANASSNLDKINDEGNAIIEEIDRIAKSTEYAGSSLLDGRFGVEIAVGSSWASDMDYFGLGDAHNMVANTTYNVSVATTSSPGYSITVQATVAGTSITETAYADPTGQGLNEIRTVTFEELGITLETYGDLNTTDSATLFADEGGSNFQVGAKSSSNDRINISFTAVTTGDLGISANQLQNAGDAQNFLTSIDNAIDSLNNARGKIGAVQNRLGYAAANLSTTIENVQAAESVIRDVDMSSEMTSFTKSQILMQAGTAMLAQANMAPQNVLSLIG